MAKRSADDDDTSPHSKRQRLTDNRPDNDRSSKADVDKITSAKHLRGLLAFKQEAGPDTKRSIHTFKHFLESIAYGQDGPLQSARKDVLLEYLNSQPVFPSGQDSTYAFDLVKTWSFAAQCNNEALFAAVAAVLALLLKTLSFHIESREYGRNVCHLLLQNDHIKLFERGLSAQKTKDHLISACLRLLTEIVLFDGGSSAKRLYRLKDITFKRLDTFLSLRQDVKPAAVSSSRRKPSIRNLALRYLFANLRLQDHAIKIEILGNGRILRSVFQDLKTDAPPIVREILDVAEDDILKDDKIPRRVKGRLFTDQVLASIATLYGYRHHDDPMQDAVLDTPPENISASAHALLLSICTKPEYGVLIGHEKRDPAAEGDGDDVPNIPDHEAAGLLHKHTSRPKTIKNHTLSSFLQTLRPYANDMQRSLTLATFRAAPELLADYFRKMKTFSFDPKLTATWVGFAAFLLATISLPIEERMVNPDGQGLLAPSIADIIESILPMPLSPKAVSRCLSQNSKLVKFFAIKTLSAAFHKFSQHLGRFRSSRRTAGNNHHDDVWVSAASSLTEEFSQRCPDMSHVITVFRSCTPQEDVLREASARLLSLYYQHLPQTALEQKFDASTALTAAFKMAMSTTQPEERPTLEPVVLEHLIVVAECSPDIRWWQKSQDEALSLFGNGLRLYTIWLSGTGYHSLEVLLQAALTEGLSLESRHGTQLLATILRSLAETQEWQPAEALFRFLDDCLARLSKKSVKYHQDLLGQAATVHDYVEQDYDCLGGQLLMVMLEQWPFVQNSAASTDLENICRWFSRYLVVLKRNGGDAKLLDHVRGSIRSTTTKKSCRKLLKGSSEVQPNGHLGVEPMRLDVQASPPPMTLQAGIPKKDHARADVRSLPSPPAPEDEDHPGLGRFKTLDVEEAVVEGAVGELMLCLCSKYAEIRKQALLELRMWMKKVEASQYSEREPLYLLAGEVAETVRISGADEALPYFAGVAAAEFCLVLSNPLHNLYAKVNRFLNRAPTWKVEKMPSYWVDQVLMHLPTNDDAHYKEIGWLLDLLIDGLRTNADMELYRRCHILERLLSLLASPSLQPSYREKILTLLFRCSYADGSTTLITRYSLLSWMQCIISSRVMTGPQAAALDHLIQHCIASCSERRVCDWSDGKIIGTLDAGRINETAC